MPRDFNNSSYTITSAKLYSYGNSKPFDLDGFITQVHFTQSMDMASYTCVIVVTDAIGIAENLPIRAEERIDLQLSVDDLQSPLKVQLQIYKVSDLTIGDNSATVSFTAHCISTTSFNMMKRRITKHYKGTTEKIAKEMFDEYIGKVGSKTQIDPDYKSNGVIRGSTFPYAVVRYELQGERERFFFVQPGASILNFIIPRYTPVKAMDFLAAKSYQPETASHTFRFFENWIGYYFVTDEFFFERAKQNKSAIQLFYSPTASSDYTDTESQIGRIDSLSNPERGLNTGKDIFSGKYMADVFEIDLLKRTTRIEKFDYLKDGTKFVDATGNTRKLSSMPHTEQFIKDTFTEENSHRYIIVRDYQSAEDLPSTLKAETHYAEIALKRDSYRGHLMDMVVNAELRGRADITPGRIIDLSISASGGNSAEKHNQLAGKYLVYGTRHAFVNFELKTSLTLVKYDWSTT